MMYLEQHVVFNKNSQVFRKKYMVYFLIHHLKDRESVSLFLLEIISVVLQELASQIHSQVFIHI